MTRRKIREEVFKIVYQSEFFGQEEMDGQIDSFLSEKSEYYLSDLPMEGETPGREFGPDEEAIVKKAKDILSKKAEIDAIIDESTEGWKTSRMAKVDLSIIRVAVYEMRFEDIAKGVAINEAVEIAKIYAGDQSPAFINGVLAKI